MLSEQIAVVDGAAGGVTPRLVPAPAAARTGQLAARSPAPAPARWARTYLTGLVAGEALLAAVAAVLLVVDRGPRALTDPLVVACAALVVVWPALLGLTGAYSTRHLGAGSEEHRRVVRAGVIAMALVGFLSYAAQLQLSRALVVFAVPGLVLGSLLVRQLARRRLGRLRASGRCTRPVVVVGRGGAVLSLVEQLRRLPQSGLVVVGTCVTEADRERVGRRTGLPVGGLDDVLDVAARTGAQAVAVTSASETAAEYLRSLSWALEGSALELLVAPGLVEVAGPRLHIRPFEGLPLLSVEQPRFEGWRRVVKTGVDRTAALLGLLLLSPALLLVGLAVALDSPGPVLFRQERVGKDGRVFRMLKFRSMVADADSRLGELAAANESDGVLFKIRHDPRVTRTGRWLRRSSLDELPQLVNVLTGSMSLVGPRPPLPVEVERYDGSVRRRLLVAPGLTGLWQISGRSDLSWEESVRLDLRYVENWSLAMDAVILWRTARAVVTSSGAY